MTEFSWWQEAVFYQICPRSFDDGVNVADQQDDPTSMLTFYRQLLTLRKAVPALRRGDYEPLLNDSATCLCFLRIYGTQRVMVLLNFSDAPQVLQLDGPRSDARVLFSSGSRLDTDLQPAMQLAPFEILIAELESA